MTRADAILLIRYATCVMTGLNKGLARLMDTALDNIIAAPRGPQPDPDTGLMPCGCGGKAEVGDGNKAFCGRCGITTLEQFTQEDAKSEWNAAMGWRGNDD